MSQPKVSILIPIFNVDKYLRECLDSVVSQTLKDIEIICINDGSTDGSLKTIEEYATRDPRIVIIDKKNSGYGDSMNKGLAKASGEYVGIIESDDFAEPKMFATLYKLAKKYDAEVAKGSFYYYYADLTSKSSQWDDTIGAIYSTELRQVIKDHNTVSNYFNPNDVGRLIDPRIHQSVFYMRPAIWAGIYRREFLKKNDIKFLPTPGASYQDTGFNLKVWASARRAILTTKPLLHYRHDNETSSVKDPGKALFVAEEYHAIEDFLAQKGLTDKLGPLAQKTKYGAYMWNFRRLKDGAERDFLRHMSKEYRAAEASGILDLAYFDINQRRDLREIISDPDKFLSRRQAREKAKVSVIVPVFNTEKHLARCLDSLLGQTLKDIEIICVNDGSKDNSQLILDEYYEKDPRIVLLETGNGGPAAARNRGTGLATADYLMFCDSDDYFNLDACKKMYEAITKNKVDLAVCEIALTYDDPTLAAHYRHSDKVYYALKHSGKVEVTSSVIKKTGISPCNKIFRSDLLKKYDIQFPTGLWYEDTGFCLDYLLISQTAYFLKDEALYNYVRQSGGIMSATSGKTPRAIDHVRVMITVFHFMKDNDLLKGRTDLFTDLFSSYYLAALRYFAGRNQGAIFDLVKRFLHQNGSYLDSVDPKIRQSIKCLLPRQSLKVRGAHYTKKKLRKPVLTAHKWLSLNYRRQSAIMQMIANSQRKLTGSDKALEKKIDKLDDQLEEIKVLLTSKKG